MPTKPTAPDMQAILDDLILRMKPQNPQDLRNYEIQLVNGFPSLLAYIRSLEADHEMLLGTVQIMRAGFLNNHSEKSSELVSLIDSVLSSLECHP